MVPIIEIKNLSKKYQIGKSESKHATLRDLLTRFFSNPYQSINNLMFPNKKEFWALRNINLEIFSGEVIGIIGPNGAGKSTLLKILSRITYPSKGEVILRGRTSSLLEVGTGFHPELTGRENIYLNGSILGMTHKEISKKMDSIVEFAGVEKFLDTPIKFYSSGMQTRLGFAVAAHLNPDILIVDEVLSVGDTAFQKKSLGKMRDVSKQGRTVLFVSHNLSAISALCQKVILLQSGRITTIGDPETAISKYLEIHKTVLPERSFISKSYKNDIIRIITVKVINEERKVLESFDIRKPLGIEVAYRVNKPKVYFACNIQVRNTEGTLLFNSPEDNNPDLSKAPKVKGIFKSTCWIPGNFLSEGVFIVRISVSGFLNSSDKEIEIPEAVIFNVHDKLEGNSVRGKNSNPFPGVVRPKLNWTRQKI